jgi:hypothetical protein
VLRGSYARLTALQWKELYPNAILDEVQKEPRLIESIKSVYDQWTEPCYVLSGSSQLLLLEKVRESLAGRCTIVDLYPLTIPELETEGWEEAVNDSPFQSAVLHPLDISRQIQSLYPNFLLDPAHAKKWRTWDHYLRFGGYPALTNSELDDESRQARNVTADAHFFYLRTLDGLEVDLFVELAGYFAFEIKSAERVSPVDARRLRVLEEFLDTPLLHSFVLSNDSETRNGAPTVLSPRVEFLQVAVGKAHGSRDAVISGRGHGQNDEHLLRRPANH